MRHPNRSFTRPALLLLALLIAGCTSHSPECPLTAPVPLVAVDFPEELMLAVPATNEARQAAVYASFETVQCDSLATQWVSRREGSNVLCRVAGQLAGAATVLVGAHFDTYPGSPGVADNWSGTVMLTSLARHFARHTPRHNFVFVAFAGEETDLLGARQYVYNADKLPDAMINLDTLGLRPLEYDRRGDRGLQCIAEQLGITRSPSMLNVTGDWEMFRRAGVPVLSLQSLHRSDRRLIHSRRDTHSLIAQGELQRGMNQVLTLLRYLDETGLDEVGVRRTAH